MGGTGRRAATSGPGHTSGLGRSVLMDEAYQALLALIMDEGLAPGTALRVETIAREWNVSATPLREALAKLENTGLVVRIPLKGYTVAPMLTEAEFSQLMAARLLIEPFNARHACETDPTGAAESLREWHSRMESASAQRDADDFRAYLEADSAFHDVIAEKCGNRFLREAIDPLGAHVQRFRRFQGSRVTDAEVALAEHRGILNAFEAGEPDRCETAMRDHLRGVAARAADAVADAR